MLKAVAPSITIPSNFRKFMIGQEVLRVSRLSFKSVKAFLIKSDLTGGEIKTTPRFIELHAAIWAVLRDEVLKGYAQQLQGAAA